MTDKSVLVFGQQPHLVDPLPLEVAKAWGFPLSHIIGDNGKYYYKLRDWLTGCVDKDYAEQSIRNRRRDSEGVYSKHGFDVIVRQEETSSGQTAQEEYVLDEILYRLTQDIRSTKNRKASTAVGAIKDYLAKAGAFVDKARIEQDKKDKRKLQAQTAYEIDGYDHSWATRRVDGKEAQKRLSDASTVTHETHTPDYGRIFGAQYPALFERTKKMLAADFGLEGKQADNVRDHLGKWALEALRLASDGAADKMKKLGRNLTDDEQVEIVVKFCKIIAPTMRQMAEESGDDWLSGVKLPQTKQVRMLK